MRSRLQKVRPRLRTVPSSDSSISIHQDIENDANSTAKSPPASDGATNTMNTNGATPESRHNNNANIPSTIRTVPSFEAPSDSSYSESPSARNSGFSSSVNSNSGASYISQPPQTQSESTVRLKPQSPGPEPTLARSPSIISQMSSSDATARGKENLADVPVSLQVPESTAIEDQSPSAPESSPQWDSTIGKAGLGKTGRVINKLVSDNEALKRDIKIERLKADESKQAAKLLEDKMERMVSDYESRLLEANVTKTLLSRKERQVEHLQAAAELEKKRTADAQERERTWREEMEKSRRDTKVQVEEANVQAALMEGRYTAIASHWKGQGDEVKRAMTGLNGQIGSLVEERKKDDEKINTLRDLCDQQDGNIRDLRKQNDDIGQQFEAYKREQEAALGHIKDSAREREEEQLRTIEETKRVLGQLRWALNVKRDVEGAQ